MSKQEIVALLNYHEVGGRSDWVEDPPGGIRPSRPELVYATEYFALALEDVRKILKSILT